MAIALSWTPSVVVLGQRISCSNITRRPAQFPCESFPTYVTLGTQVAEGWSFKYHAIFRADILRTGYFHWNVVHLHVAVIASTQDIYEWTEHERALYGQMSTSTINVDAVDLCDDSQRGKGRSTARRAPSESFQSTLSCGQRKVVLHPGDAVIMLCMVKDKETDISRRAPDDTTQHCIPIGCPVRHAKGHSQERLIWFDV